MDATDSFGYWVRRQRKALDLTQAELARRVGCAAVTLRKIEADERRPSRPMAERLANCLGLPPADSARFVAIAVGDQAAVALPLPSRLAVRRMPGNLPAPPTALVGREAEIAAIIDGLSHHKMRLLTLTGPMGVGKSRLAVAVGHQLLTEYQQGVYVVALATIADPGLVPTATANALGVRERRSQGLAQTVANFLVNRRVLLILDNFEHLLPAAPFVSTLLAACSGLDVLVTSQSRLHLYGEHEIGVAPLAVPEIADVQGAAETPAVQLFCQCAQAARADFRLTPALTPVVAEICRRLDGLPLAIELAAARIKLFSAQELLRRMEQRLLLLSQGALDVPPRRQSLEHAIAWSYGLLTPTQSALLARLAVFAGGFSLAAAEAVCALPIDAAAVLPESSASLGLSESALGVAALLDHNLLVRQAASDGAEAGGERCPRCPTRQVREVIATEPRFSMLSIIREYALDRLDESGDRPAIEQRHAAYFAAWAAEAVAHLQGSDQAIWLARLERDADNLRAALQYLLSTAQIEMAAELACALGILWQRRGRYSEGRDWLVRVLAQMRGVSVPEALRARTLQTAAMLAYRQGNWQVARDELQASLSLYQAVADEPGMARVLFDLGWIALDEGQWEVAARLNQDSLALARTARDPQAAYRALTNLGWARLCQGTRDAAAALFREAYDQAARLQHVRGVAVSLVNLGWIALAEGELAEADRLARQSVQLCHLLEEREVLAEGLEILAATALAAGETWRAARLSGGAEGLWEALHVTRPPVQQAEAPYAQALAPLRGLSEATDLAAAWDGGRAMSMDGLVALALRCRE